jgi:hypothetical protein
MSVVKIDLVTLTQETPPVFTDIFTAEDWTKITNAVQKSWRNPDERSVSGREWMIRFAVCGLPVLLVILFLLHAAFTNHVLLQQSNTSVGFGDVLIFGTTIRMIGFILLLVMLSVAVALPGHFVCNNVYGKIPLYATPAEYARNIQTLFSGEDMATLLASKNAKFTTWVQPSTTAADVPTYRHVLKVHKQAPML